MNHKTVIEIPISIGDTIYKKCRKVVNCRYFGDKYSDKDGQPHCLQHEYDCDPKIGKPCDATFKYYVEPIKVNDLILCNFADEVIRKNANKYNTPSEIYLLTKEDADAWIASKS